jgi:hypothetical protein
MNSPAMKAALLLISEFVFSFIAAGSDLPMPSDETIREQIAGTWISNELLDGRTTTLTVEYRPDGTIGASGEIINGRYRLKLVLTGTWRVRRGVLISHTEATGMAPRTTVHEVIAVNQTILVLRDRDGRLLVKRRAH